MDAVEMPKQRLGGRRGKAFQGTEGKLLVCMAASSGIRAGSNFGRAGQGLCVAPWELLASGKDRSTGSNRLMRLGLLM